ncbi:histidine kinase [Luteolibacter arcticus]|uniref:Histidine kinase n=1 Tax=Luteolibacter arcticus TaxID=1581411 RepID=A0ABT3GER0_9BACT|nr:histidine kinase [Luteolibacter arcticus]MCW1922096.1 histidine kinase [Luteolibacter arcticus]
MASKDPGESTDWEVATTNPGNNPFLVQFDPLRSRRVRIGISSLWKAYDSFPAYAAFCEIEVLDGGKNIARGAPVGSSESAMRIGRTESLAPTESTLTDGLGQRGRLVSSREWLLGLDQRLKLERQLYGLQQEKAAIAKDWRITGWIVLAVLGGVGTLVLIVLPVRYRLREKLHISQVRDRIASDLHDEVGSNLGSIQMLADLAEGHAAGTGPTKELKRIQRIAAETVSAVRDIVWLLRPQGDHRIGTVEHLRETSSIMLEPLEWEFTANEAAWQCEMSDESNRHLFLFFREALHNLLRHSGAKKATIRVECDDQRFHLTVADDGCGIPPEKLERPSTLRALRQRVEALGAEFKVDTRPGEGTRLELGIPLGVKPRKKQAAAAQPGIAPG